MLSPLFEGTGFFDDSWEMTAFQREAAALTEMHGFWTEVENEAQEYNIVAPADTDLEEDLIDWSVGSDQHKDKVVHHDCMWAGLCDDKVHPDNSPWTEDEQPETVQSAAPGKSLLLVQRYKRDRSKTPPKFQMLRPDTPPSPDDSEPPQFRHQVDLASTATKIFSRREDPTSTYSNIEQDHTYTLSKPVFNKYPNMDNLGVQTPSDSEEEIDVVSIGEKTAQMGAISNRTSNLPYVPSILDRHNIQRTVASAMSPTQSRKRTAQVVSEPPRKRGRGPGRRHHKRRSSPDTDSDLENTDIEKRSLHNDMERMRRIGLKNLFDQLKLQVPATRDKERAPKVVILREAAALCKRLQNQDKEYEAEKKKQARLIAKLKKLRTTMAPMYRKPIH